MIGDIIDAITCISLACCVLPSFIAYEIAVATGALHPYGIAVATGIFFLPFFMVFFIWALLDR